MDTFNLKPLLGTLISVKYFTNKKFSVDLIAGKPSELVHMCCSSRESREAPSLNSRYSFSHLK